MLILKGPRAGAELRQYVGRLVTGTPLPAPVAQRDADRTALRRSCDQLAALAGDINALIRLIRLARVPGGTPVRRPHARPRGRRAAAHRHSLRLVAHQRDQS